MLLSNLRPWGQELRAHRRRNLSLTLLENTRKRRGAAIQHASRSSPAMPRLIIPSLQVNMRGGQLPTDEAGIPMLKVPINRF